MMRVVWQYVHLWGLVCAMYINTNALPKYAETYIPVSIGKKFHGYASPVSFF